MDAVPPPEFTVVEVEPILEFTYLFLELEEGDWTQGMMVSGFELDRYEQLSSDIDRAEDRAFLFGMGG